AVVSVSRALGAFSPWHSPHRFWRIAATSFGRTVGRGAGTGAPAARRNDGRETSSRESPRGFMAQVSPAVNGHRGREGIPVTKGRIYILRFWFPHSPHTNLRECVTQAPIGGLLPIFGST